MPSMGKAPDSKAADRKAGSATGMTKLSTKNMAKGCKNNLPNAICVTGPLSPSTFRPTKEPPMTNKDNTALACANKFTVRANGADSAKSNHENKKPLAMPQIMGFLARFFRVCATTCFH